MVEMPSSVLSKLGTTLPGYALMHNGFCDVEVAITPTVINVTNVVKLTTPNREMVAGGNTQVYVESGGVKNLVTLAHLSLNSTTRPKLAVHKEGKIVWEELTLVAPFKTDEPFSAMTVMGLNQAVIINSIFVR